jgi:hypothetical protein
MDNTQDRKAQKNEDAHPFLKRDSDWIPEFKPEKTVSSQTMQPLVTIIRYVPSTNTHIDNTGILVYHETGLEV